MPETDALANRVKEYRRSMCINQFEMSCEIGICEEELSLIERGRTDPKLSTIQKIAACMGITVSKLLEVEPKG